MCFAVWFLRTLTTTKYRISHERRVNSCRYWTIYLSLYKHYSGLLHLLMGNEEKYSIQILIMFVAILFSITVVIFICSLFLFLQVLVLFDWLCVRVPCDSSLFMTSSQGSSTPGNQLSSSYHQSCYVNTQEFSKQFNKRCKLLFENVAAGVPLNDTRWLSVNMQTMNVSRFLFW